MLMTLAERQMCWAWRSVTLLEAGWTFPALIQNTLIKSSSHGKRLLAVVRNVWYQKSASETVAVSAYGSFQAGQHCWHGHETHQSHMRGPPWEEAWHPPPQGGSVLKTRKNRPTDLQVLKSTVTTNWAQNVSNDPISPWQPFLFAILTSARVPR